MPALWTDERLDDAFREIREDIRDLRSDWQSQVEQDINRRHTERAERKKDRWAFIGSVIASFGVLAPVLVIVVSNSP